MNKIVLAALVLCLIFLIPLVWGNTTTYDASLAEWVNLLPAVPNVGQSSTLTAKIRTPGKSESLFAVFRSSKETVSYPLKDDGTNGDKTAGDGIFTCIFPAQKAPGLWYCLVAEGQEESKRRYSIPQSFIVTEKETEYRAIWADSWNGGFLTREQAKNLVKTARDANLNTLIIEVRKAGDAYYKSAYEPRASNLEDPSYDPLKYVIDLAHDTKGGEKRIEVHAWIVAYRIYKGKAEGGFPKAPHILGKHPEWASANSKGSQWDDGSVYLDPGVPGVTDYNIDVCLDIIRKYDVDGINFDYIRYPAQGWGFNPTAVSRFKKLYHKTQSPSANDPQWLAFQREQVTHFLRKAYVKMIAEKPQLKVSVCTIGWGDIPNGDFLQTDSYAGVQDWPEWSRRHILDVNFRMGYKRQSEEKQKKQFENWTRFTLGSQYFRLSTIGLGAYLNTLDGTLAQLKTARNYGANGVAIYSYFSPTKESISRNSFYSNLKAQGFAGWKDVPPLAWKIANPNGILAGTVYETNTPLDGTEISLPEMNLSTRTDGTGFYAFMDVPPGEFQVSMNGRIIGKKEIKSGQINTFDIR